MKGINKIQIVLITGFLLAAVVGVSAYTDMTSDGEIPVIIMMKNTPATSLNQQGLTRADTVQAIRQSAANDQKSIIGTLKSRGAKEITPLWIANAVAAKVTPDMIKELQANPAVAKIEPDYIVYLDDKDPEKTTGTGHRSILSKPENEPLERSLGDVVETIKPISIGWGVQWIEAPAVWEQGITGKGVKVGLIDSGINPDHPDLKGKVLLWKDFVNNRETPYDDYGHGSHVAGIIAGTGAGGIKTGVAPGVNFLVAKVFNSQGYANSSKVMEAFQWAVDNGADVISYSGGSYALQEQFTYDYEYINSSTTRQVIIPVNSTYWGDSSLKPAYILVDVYSPRMQNLTITFYAPNGSRIEGTPADWLDMGDPNELIFKYSESNPLPAGNYTLNITQNDRNMNHWWFSGNENYLNNRLTHSFDLSNVTTATLTFNTYYDTEQDYDYGYVEISRDGGITWTILATYNGYASLTPQQINLNPYTGSTVLLRYRYTTDGSVNYEGWYVDNIAIPEIGFIDNVESGSGTWTTNGWTILEAQTAYDYYVGVGYPDDGTSARAQSVNTIAAFGVIPVISAGNNGEFGLYTIGTPGSAKDAITVGAIDEQMDYITYYSSRGPVGYGANQTIKPDFVAPGEDIVSASGTGSGYTYMSGTSMAAPHVTGTVALMLQANGSLTTLDVKRILQNSAVDLGLTGPDNTYGAGRISTYAAVANVTPLPAGDGPNHLFAGFAKSSDAVVGKSLVLSAISWNKTPKAGTQIGFVVWNSSSYTTEVFNGTLVTDSNGWANITIAPTFQDQGNYYNARITDQYNNTITDQIYIQYLQTSPVIRNPDTIYKWYEAKPNSTVDIRYSLLTPANTPYDQPVNISIISGSSYFINQSVVPQQGTIELTLNLSQYRFDDNGGYFQICLVNATGSLFTIGYLEIYSDSGDSFISPQLTSAQPGSKVDYMFFTYDYLTLQPLADRTYTMEVFWLNETQVHSLNVEQPELAQQMKSQGGRWIPGGEKLSDRLNDFKETYQTSTVTTINGVGLFSLTVPPGAYEGYAVVYDRNHYGYALIVVNEAPWMHHSAFKPNDTYILTLDGNWGGISDDAQQKVIPNDSAEIMARLTTSSGFSVPGKTVYLYTPYEVKAIQTDAYGYARTTIAVHPDMNLSYYQNSVQVFGVFDAFTYDSIIIQPPEWYVYPAISASHTGDQLDVTVRHLNQFTNPINFTTILSIEGRKGTQGSRILQGKGGGISVLATTWEIYDIIDAFRSYGSWSYWTTSFYHTGVSVTPQIRSWYTPDQLVPIQVHIPGGSNGLVYVEERSYSYYYEEYIDSFSSIFGYINTSRCDANGNAVLYLKVPHDEGYVDYRIGYASGVTSIPTAKSGYFYVTPNLAPDLVPSTDIPVIVAPGDVTFNVSIRNTGTATAGASQMALVIDHIPVGTNSVNALSPGERQSFTFTHNFATGMHNVTAIADVSGQIHELSEYNNVGIVFVVSGVQPPVANFTANVTSGIKPTTVQFTDLSTNSPTSWVWNFGDNETANVQNPVHTYVNSGLYTVTLVASNEVGSDSEVKIQYIAIDPEPSPTIIMPQNVVIIRNATVNVPVRMAHLKDASGFSFNITYNSSVIRMNAVTANESAIGGSSITANITPGLARIVVTNTNGINVGNSIPILNLSITAVGSNAAVTPLSAMDAQWSNSSFDPHTLIGVNGSIRIGIRGDFNGNGVVDIGDVSRVAYMVVNRAPVLIPDADFNNNGIVDVGDAAKIAWYFIGKINEL